jgi:putative colanic acid biosynthesis acetyltransferase WcaF
VKENGSDPIRPAYRHQASFSLSNKLLRVCWMVGWFVLARHTPPQFHAWRRLVLCVFGAKVGRRARIYPSCRIWNPRNLEIEEGAVIGRRVNCYNQGRITVGKNVVISQDASLCASTHDINDPYFPLLIRPIYIEDDAWIAAESFVGPGVTIGRGAVLGARAVAMKDLKPWTFYSGNPAIPLKERQPIT